MAASGLDEELASLNGQAITIESLRSKGHFWDAHHSMNARVTACCDSDLSSNAIWAHWILHYKGDHKVAFESVRYPGHYLDMNHNKSQGDHHIQRLTPGGGSDDWNIFTVQGDSLENVAFVSTRWSNRVLDSHDSGELLGTIGQTSEIWARFGIDVVHQSDEGFEIQLVGKHFTPKDADGLADPFFLLSGGRAKRQLYRSPVIRNSLSPEWDPFKINVNEAGGLNTPLEVLVYDYDDGAPDEFIGKFTATLNQLKEGRSFQLHNLKGLGHQGEEEVTGTIEIHKSNPVKYGPLRKKHQGSEVDVLIVGGGFSGCWFADKIRREHPELTIRLIEKSFRIGGRLKSDDNDQGALVKDELGGMRQFPDQMPLIKALVDRFDLHLLPLGLGDGQNLFRYHDFTVKKKEAKVPGDGKWAGKAPTALSSAAVAAYKASKYWEACKHQAYDCVELRNLSIREFFKKYAGASDAEIDCWFAYSGYNLYHDDVQASIYVQDGELYGSESTHHYFVKEGYMSVVTSLLDASGIEAEEGTSLLSLKKEGDTFIAKIDSARIGGDVIKAKRVFLGLTQKQLDQIEGVEEIISLERRGALKACKPIALFKCFLDFPKPWWLAQGFPYGKTTTDLDSRQIHYYDEDDLLVYVSDGDKDHLEFATRWGTAFAEDRSAALRKMWNQVRHTHLAAGVPEEAIVEPLWDECVWAYWPSGSHKWKIGADVNHCIDLVADGASDGSNLYIAGDAWSDMQGWIEGAIHTCEIAYRKAFPAP